MSTRHVLIPTLLLLALTACGGGVAPVAKKADGDDAARKRGEAEDKDKDKSKKGGMDVITWDAPTPHDTITLDALPAGEPAFVALVVMDTVRASHTSLCGYERPNTPFLEKHSAVAKGWSCEAYSPATWTLPAHASYFTGRPTAEHGVHTLGTPLADRFDTLAELYAAKGYQTLFISANPVFGAAEGGFWQGFDRVVVAEGLRGPLRTELGKHLKTEFERLDSNKPVFLILNIFDAHDPYPEVPEGLDWVAPQESLSLHPHTADPSKPYYQYVTGKMAKPKIAPYLDKVRDAYDHAVFEADANFGLLIRGLVSTGWLDKPHRMVVTSDHGEHLGEHGLLRHGSAVWQTVTQVPFLYFDNIRTEPLELPKPLSATTAFPLLLTGQLPSPALPVESASARNEEDFKPSWESVAVWGEGSQKLMILGDKRGRFDLSADPGEESPETIPADDPLLPLLEERFAAHGRSLEEAAVRGQDDRVMELMRSVGYVQDDEDE